MKKVERWKMEMPTEEEMLPKDKYSVFDRKVKRYRKGIHSELVLFLFPVLREMTIVWVHGVLTMRRGAQVDESQPATQSSGFLEMAGKRCGAGVYYGCFHTAMGALGERNILDSAYLSVVSR